VILDEHLAGIGGIEVCRTLHDDPNFDPATPIIITSSTPTSRGSRIAAYSAGAWDFCTQPIDTETLLLELSTYVRAKRALSEARGRALIDETTGVLSPMSMERWAEQLTARASRNHEPLACVVLMPRQSARGTSSFVPNVEDINQSVASFLQLSREHFRRSDIVGRTPDGRVAVLAPATDANGVLGLLARLRAAIETAMTAGIAAATLDFRAGYWAAQDFATTPLEPSELIRRAGRALDHANSAPGEDLAIGFDQLPIS
jgi:PleD family two-component response regulator